MVLPQTLLDRISILQTLKSYISSYVLVCFLYVQFGMCSVLQYTSWWKYVLQKILQISGKKNVQQIFMFFNTIKIYRLAKLLL